MKTIIDGKFVATTLSDASRDKSDFAFKQPGSDTVYILVYNDDIPKVTTGDIYWALNANNQTLATFGGHTKVFSVNAYLHIE